VKWLKTGYPHFKEESGLPKWVLPHYSFSRITDELGDYRILQMSQPLSFANGEILGEEGIYWFLKEDAPSLYPHAFHKLFHV